MMLLWLQNHSFVFIFCLFFCGFQGKTRKTIVKQTTFSKKREKPLQNGLRARRLKILKKNALQMKLQQQNHFLKKGIYYEDSYIVDNYFESNLKIKLDNNIFYDDASCCLKKLAEAIAAINRMKNNRPSTYDEITSHKPKTAIKKVTPSNITKAQ